MATVIFPAAGRGKRMEAGKNKVLLDLQGKPILLRTLLAFSNSEQVDDLIVVVAAAEVEEVTALLKRARGLKPWRVVAGGEERQHSVANGLAALPLECKTVLIHDAARPFVSAETIAGVVEEAKKSGAAIAAVLEKNTIKIVNEKGIVTATPDRAHLWSVQTPQGFSRGVIQEAYEQAERDHFLGTDDAGLVERMGRHVTVVESDYRNIKITTPEDLIIAAAFLNQNREGSGKG